MTEETDKFVDFDGKKTVFPPEIYSTPERPDVVIWSGSRKSVILIELTCPSEEGFVQAQGGWILTQT